MNLHHKLNISHIIFLSLIISGCTHTSPSNQRVTGDCKLTLTKCSSRQTVIAPTAEEIAGLTAHQVRIYKNTNRSQIMQNAQMALHDLGFAPVRRQDRAAVIEGENSRVLAASWERGLRMATNGGLIGGSDHSWTVALLVFDEISPDLRVRVELMNTIWDSHGNSETRLIVDPAPYDDLFARIADPATSQKNALPQEKQEPAPEHAPPDTAFANKAAMAAAQNMALRRIGGCEVTGLHRCSSTQLVQDPSPADAALLADLSSRTFPNLSPDQAEMRLRRALTDLQFQAVESTTAGIIRGEINAEQATRSQRRWRALTAMLLNNSTGGQGNNALIGAPDHSTLDVVATVAASDAPPGSTLWLNFRYTIWDSKGDAHSITVIDRDLFAEVWSRISTD